MVEKYKQLVAFFKEVEQRVDKLTRDFDNFIASTPLGTFFESRKRKKLAAIHEKWYGRLGAEPPHPGPRPKPFPRTPDRDFDRAFVAPFEWIAVAAANHKIREWEKRAKRYAEWHERFNWLSEAQRRGNKEATRVLLEWQEDQRAIDQLRYRVGDGEDA
jgi:hypothetical protein